ncbi:MAG: A-macroglobulin complement component [Verrucomicrobia bacterium]|nr:A-macroglobulin complement component [Verrucomicrobiota bacterium]
MNFSSGQCWLVFLAGAVACSFVFFAGNPGLAATAATKDLGGEKRFLTHLSTDKPIYRPGEILRVRGVILHAQDCTPLDHPVSALIMVEGPKGDTIASGVVNSEDSVVGFAWTVPEEQAGGTYTVRVSFPIEGYAPAERKFDIRAYRAPRLKSQIVFLRDGYGPGDTVSAALHVERAEGGAPTGAQTTVIARVDGAEVYHGKTSVNAQGNCTAGFSLPAQIERGEGTLAFVIEDGGISETATKTIPILLQAVDVSIYPEGGDLVAGLPMRVYVEARTPAHKPADIAGVVVDGEGADVAAFRTEHEGRGRFTFTPAKGGKYNLRITQPTGIKAVYPLPELKEDGVTIRAVENVTPKDEAIAIEIGSATDRKVSVTLRQRETQVAAIKTRLKAGRMREVTLTPPLNAGGILIATVWGEDGTPLAERLVFRQPARTLHVSIRREKKTFCPGDQGKLTVKTTDDEGKPVAAVLGVTVTDDTVLEMIEKREQAPRLPAMVLLENDVQELADAHIYLDPKNPKGALAMDLLLGTQGWRRFALVDVSKFVSTHGSAARRVLALCQPEPMRLRERGAEVMKEGFERKAFAEAKDLKLRAVPAADRPAAMPAAKPAGPKASFAPAQVLDDKDMRMDEKEGKKQFRREMAQEMAIRNDFAVVRVYAHPVRPDRNPNDRVDFTETLFWNAAIKTDGKTGEATVAFALNDSVTTFRVLADAFAANGALGEGVGAIESVQPFYIEPKLPLEVSTGDVIQMSVGIVNSLNTALKETRIEARAAGDITIADGASFTTPSASRKRQLIPVTIGLLKGGVDFIVSAQAGSYSDKVTRRLNIKPRGFPVEQTFGGMLGANATVAHTILMPAEVVAGSLTGEVTIYPTPLASMNEALAALIQEPCGCFEQTSSSCYPLVMAQQYFLSHTGVEPQLIERSREMLNKGYQRLTGYECKQRGYEWFGGDPGHEALTAYGLLEFTDMARVRDVDAAMLARTRQWLLARRDGNGGFKRNAGAADSFGRAPTETTDAYVVWALIESGEKGLAKEVGAIASRSAAGKDSYITALAANILHLDGDKSGAKKRMDQLAARQVANGSVEGGQTSITQSGGEALTIETTSLAALAWLRDPAYAANVEKAMNFLAQSCKAGRFGSTQSTILALRAINAYDKQRAGPRADGKARVFVDGQSVGSAVPFDPKTQGAIKLPDIGELLTPGRHKIEVKMEGGGDMPYSVAVKYNTARPVSSKECKIALKVALTDQQVTEGGITEANVSVENLGAEPIPTPVAIIGIPGGLEPRHDQLKELVKAGKVDAYEVIGREVVFYWRGLKGGQQVNLPLSLIAAIPGAYTGPASRAYLYYTDEFKNWADPLQITITADSRS